MLRTTLYGTLTRDEELDKNEKAMLYIKECAELAGLEVIEGETALSMTFMAEIMERLRETVNNQHQWIPVDEGLPPKDTTVWVTTKHDSVYLGEVWLYEGGEFSWYINDDNHSPSYVKAWKPCNLPEPYKEEKPCK